MIAAQPDQPPGEIQQHIGGTRRAGLAGGLARRGGWPVHPGDLAVLAVGVVIAPLGAAHLVARGQHRHPLGQQQRGQEVALLPLAQPENPGVVRGALGAAVP